MTDFSKAVAGCIADWGKRAAGCNGSVECLEGTSRQLRKCLDRVFPDSNKLDVEGDKVNYMLSSVFFLANRLTKASQGLAEFDKIVGTAQELSVENAREPEITERSKRFSRQLDEILAKYF